MQCACQNLHGDQCHERAHGVDTAREYESSSAREIALLRRSRPFSRCLREMEVFEDVDKARVVESPPEPCQPLLHYSSSRFFEGRGFADMPIETLEQLQPFVLIESVSHRNFPPFPFQFVAAQWLSRRLFIGELNTTWQ